MKAIVAVDSNWAIGNKGQLLISIPSDHKNFRKITMGKVLIYGRKTLETFPMQHVLDGRTNIIMSSNPDYKVKDATIVHSIDELLEEVKQYDNDDCYVIGGASVYEELMPYVDECIVTVIDRAYEADKYFPNLDKDPNFEVVDESDEMTYFDTTFVFRTYKRK